MYIGFVQDAPRYGNAVLFLPLCQMRSIFTAKGTVIQGLRHFKGLHTVAEPSNCGGRAIKVLSFWWANSGANAAMFSSAAVPCLLH